MKTEYWAAVAAVPGMRQCEGLHRVRRSMNSEMLPWFLSNVFSHTLMLNYMFTRLLHLSGQCAVLFQVFASLLCSSTKTSKFRPILPIPSNISIFPPHVASLICMQKISLIIITVVAVVISSSELWMLQQCAPPGTGQSPATTSCVHIFFCVWHTKAWQGLTHVSKLALFSELFVIVSTITSLKKES